MSVSCLLFVLTAGSFASPAEVKLLETTAIKRATDELIPRFETSSGHKVIAEFGPACAIMIGMQRGAAVDVAIVTGPQSEDLKPPQAGLREVSASEPPMKARGTLMMCTVKSVRLRSS